MNIKEFYNEINGDYDDAFKRLNSDALLAKIVKMFLNDASYNDLKTGLENNDAELAFRGAHTLKGVCLNLSFSDLGNDAINLTELLRPRVITEESKTLFDNITIKYNKIIEAIKNLD